MLQSKARLLQLNAKLAETLTSKGVEATGDETTTALVNKVADITSGDDTMLKGLIQRDLTELIIPQGIIKIGSNAFSYCGNLISVTIPDSVTSIGSYAFSDCTNLESITIPSSVTSIGNNAFSSCFKLKDITIPNSITRIEASTFTNCQTLQSITIPNGVTFIGNYAFYTCIKLDNITIPNSVTSIGSYAFSDCTNLESITIPSSVTSIGSKSFRNLSNLTSVIIGDGFNANNLDLSASTLYTRETILQWLNALAERTGLTAYKLTIGATNLAKLTEQDILIATNKNWTLA